MWKHKGIWIQREHHVTMPLDFNEQAACDVFKVLLKRYHGDFNRVLSFVLKNANKTTWLSRWFKERMHHYRRYDYHGHVDGDIFAYLCLSQIYTYIPSESVRVLFTDIKNNKETLLSVMDKDSIGKHFMYYILDIPLDYYQKKRQYDYVQALHTLLNEEIILPNRHAPDTIFHLISQLSSKILKQYLHDYPQHTELLYSFFQHYTPFLLSGQLFRNWVNVKVLTSCILDLDVPVVWDGWTVVEGQSTRSVTETGGILWNVYYLRYPERVALLQNIFKGVLLAPSEVLLFLKTGYMPGKNIDYSEVNVLL